MRIDPVLRALAHDPAPQHTAQERVGEALVAWREEHDFAEVLAALADYGSGMSLDRCRPLAALMVAPQRGAGLAASLVRAFVPVLAAEPWARMPFRQASQGASASLVLGSSGRSTLKLAVRAPEAIVHDVAGFADGEWHDLVLAGAGRGEIVRRELDGALVREAIALMPGTALSLDTASEALLIDTVARVMVTLRLTRVADAPLASREYSLSDGRLVVQAAGDLRASRHEMMLAVLGRMGRADAAPVLADLARKGGGHLRWQALRECLALDTAAGFRALSTIAHDPMDELAVPAGALRAQLIEAYPALAEVRCPA